MKKNGAYLKEGKEKAIQNRHHWIFSGAIKHLPAFDDGDILPVYSSSGKLLGQGYFNSKAKIIGRLLTFDDSDPYESLKLKLQQAVSMRDYLFKGSDTNAYRLINAEGDCLPGLIVDKYADVLVLQISTLGMEKLKGRIVEFLAKTLKPRSIYEKSHLPSRKEEGLLDASGVLFGEDPQEVIVLEHGLRFSVEPAHGQKTGFFLDHREMRQMVREMSKGKTLLNCFAYSGGFSVYGLAGGASRVDSVEISEPALQKARQNIVLNGFDATTQGFYSDDVFDFLREKPLNYDLVILDPPAFAKRQKDIVAGCRGYKDINRLAMQKMPTKSLLLTCSCSYFVDESLFQKVVFQASVEAGRVVRIISKHRMAADHPINLCHPESDYLKSLLLYIES